MTEQQEEIKRVSRGRKIAAAGIVTALLLLSGLYLLINPLLNAPLVTGRISGLLSDSLGQPAAIGGIRLSGGTLLIHGLSIANPRGFGGGKLLSVRRVDVTPEWGGVLAGRKALVSISISGLALTIGKNNAGSWNFSPLLKQIASRKKSDSEIRIGRLALENSSVSVNGRAVRDISLSINDISTRGSSDSGIHLAFRDDYGALFQLQGKGRLGPQPDLDLKFTAPSFTFKTLRDIRMPLDPEKGEGRLLLNAALHGNLFKLGCDAAFDRLTVKVKGADIPISGGVVFAGQYDLKRDSATLDSCSLQVNGAFRLRARGRGERLRKERAFALEVSHDGVDFADLCRLLPLELRHGFLAGGRVLPATFNIAGSGEKGLTSAKACFAIRQARLSKGKQLFLDGVNGDAVLGKVVKGWELAGRVSQTETGGGAPLRLGEIPFTVTFNERMRPVHAEVPAFTGRVAGAPIRGNVSYREGARDPLEARIVLVDASVADLSRVFPVNGLLLGKGSLDASIRGSGRIPGLFRGEAMARLSGLGGTSKGRRIALDEGAARISFSYSGGKPSASGSIKAHGGEFAGTKLAASMTCRLADDLITLSGADFSAGRAKFGFAELSGVIPGKELSRGVGRIPLNLGLKGGRFRIDDSGADGLSGKLNAFFISDHRGRWLEGDGAITAPSLLLRGISAGSMATRVRLLRGKTMAEISGIILDGRLSASAAGDPFHLEGGGVFALNLTGINGDGLSQVIGKSYPAVISGGSLDVSATGDYSRRNGLRGRVEITGDKIALAAKNGRSILRGGALRLDAEWLDGGLILREGRGAVGKEPEIVLRGRLSKAATAEREGDITLSLPTVPVAALLDAFVNVLPRPLQEATAGGTIEAKAGIRIKGKQIALDGELNLEDASLEVPSQKLSIASVNGTIPFALDLSGKVTAGFPERMSFSRENYSSLLPLLQRGGKGEHQFTIGKLRFGTTEFGSTTLSIKGDNGLTEISSLQTELFRGALLGLGFVRYRGGVQYGADLLVHDLSLRELCNSYPAIQGYMSGRVDGVVSLYGQGKGLNDLKGFVEFWTRDSKNEKMLVSKEFLQKLSGKKLKGIFFQNDRSYDRGEIAAYMEGGYLTFRTLDMSHTNFLGIRDLSVTVAPVQNKISLDHLLTSIREAATRGKAAAGGGVEQAAPAATEFKWEE
jgi:hypothetical protein